MTEKSVESSPTHTSHTLCKGKRMARAQLLRLIAFYRRNKCTQEGKPRIDGGKRQKKKKKEIMKEEEKEEEEEVEEEEEKEREKTQNRTRH
jgi:ADP-ribosylglycohydrolase